MMFAGFGGFETWRSERESHEDFVRRMQGQGVYAEPDARLLSEGGYGAGDAYRDIQRCRALVAEGRRAEITITIRLSP